MNQYKVTGSRALHWETGSAEPGETFEAEFTQERESEHLAAGRMEIVPREYEVIGEAEVCETPPGDTFTHAFPMAQEAALLGTHIERVGAKSKAKAKADRA